MAAAPPEALRDISGSGELGPLEKFEDTDQVPGGDKVLSTMVLSSATTPLPGAPTSRGCVNDLGARLLLPERSTWLSARECSRGSP